MDASGLFVPWLRSVGVMLGLIAAQGVAGAVAAIKLPTRMNTDEHG